MKTHTTVRKLIKLKGKVSLTTIRLLLDMGYLPVLTGEGK